MAETIVLHPAGNEITIRNADGYKINQYKGLDLKGDINAPVEYHTHSQNLRPALVVLQVTEMSLKATLTYDADKEAKTVITGVLAVSPFLKPFGINEGKEYSPVQLANLIKRNRRLFAGDSFAFIKTLNDLKVAKTEDIQKAQDERGNRLVHFDKKVNGNVPDGFHLKAAIFTDDEPIEFWVDICLDVRGTDMVLWLESAQLIDVVQAEIEAKTKKIQQYFNGKGVPVIFE